MAPLSTTILYDKANSFGLKEDAAVIERLLKSITVSGHTLLKPKHVDIREPCVPCDIQFHLEIPVYAAVPWAHSNVILVNPEHWSVAYDAYVHAFDMLLFRDASAAEAFRRVFAEKGLPADRIVVLPWCSSQPVTPSTHVAQDTHDLVCFIGGSTHKYEYVKQLLSHWRQEDPSLTVYTTRKDHAEGLAGLAANVVCRDIRPEERQKLMAPMQMGDASLRQHLLRISV